MVAFVGLLVQEYVTGIPSLMALKIWLQHIIEGDAAAVISSSSSRGGGEIFSGISSSSTSLYAPSSINEPSKFLSGFIELLKGVPNIIGGDNQP